MRHNLSMAGALALLCAAGWASGSQAGAMSEEVRADGYSYANTSQFRTTHLELSLEVDFEARQLRGGVALELQRLDSSATQLVLDTKDLNILDVTELTSDIVGATSKPEPIWISRPFRLGKPDPILGSPLIVDLPASRQQKLILRIDYVTQPEARGLHWTVPTLSNPHQSPFLYTLSAPINARSWIPLQDTLRVRAPYSAHIHTADNLFALMAAKSDNLTKHGLERWFIMDRPVPAEAITLVVGDLRFKATGPRTGVYSEKPASAAAVKEFSDIGAMLQAAEKLLGAYPWERFDVAVIPKSFPVSAVGYANLAEVSPTLIAGDKSELLPLAYALASSWSGSLVSPSEWRDRWLLEAIAGYLAHRIVAAVYGGAHDNEGGAVAEDGVLAADLQDRAYDDMFNQTPQRKGNLFFGWLGEKIGPARVDGVLRTFLERYAGQSVSSAQFITFLEENVLNQNPSPLTKAELTAWLYEAGIPPGAAPVPPSVGADTAAMTSGDLKSLAPKLRQWSPVHWIAVLNAVPDSIGAARLAELDREFKLSTNPNAEIAAGWFALTLRAGYSAALLPLQNYLLTTGQLTLIEPLYEQLMQTEPGATAARRMYALARHDYHPFVTRRLEEIIKP
jgi:leukotriene-A4 hydrolase